MELKFIKFIHNGLYSVVMEEKPSYRDGYLGEARIFVIETSKLNITEGSEE